MGLVHKISERRYGALMAIGVPRVTGARQGRYESDTDPVNCNIMYSYHFRKNISDNCIHIISGKT